MLMSMVDAAVRLLNNLEELVPSLIQLGLRHNAYKVRTRPDRRLFWQPIGAYRTATQHSRAARIVPPMTPPSQLDETYRVLSAIHYSVRSFKRQGSGGGTPSSTFGTQYVLDLIGAHNSSA